MFYMDALKEIFKHADYIFGNEDECSEFGKSIGLDPSDRIGAAKYLATYEKACVQRKRTVIITQRAEPTIIVQGLPGEEPTVT